MQLPGGGGGGGTFTRATTLRPVAPIVDACAAKHQPQPSASAAGPSPSCPCSAGPSSSSQATTTTMHAAEVGDWGEPPRKKPRMSCTPAATTTSTLPSSSEATQWGGSYGSGGLPLVVTQGEVSAPFVMDPASQDDCTTQLPDSSWSSQAPPGRLGTQEATQATQQASRYQRQCQQPSSSLASSQTQPHAPASQAGAGAWMASSSQTQLPRGPAQHAASSSMHQQDQQQRQQQQQPGPHQQQPAGAGAAAGGQQQSDLLNSPPEVIDIVLSKLDAKSLVMVALCCRAFRARDRFSQLRATEKVARDIVVRRCGSVLAQRWRCAAGRHRHGCMVAMPWGGRHAMRAQPLGGAL